MSKTLRNLCTFWIFNDKTLADSSFKQNPICPPWNCGQLNKKPKCLDCSSADKKLKTGNPVFDHRFSSIKSDETIWSCTFQLPMTCATDRMLKTQNRDFDDFVCQLSIKLGPFVRYWLLTSYILLFFLHFWNTLPSSAPWVLEYV